MMDLSPASKRAVRASVVVALLVASVPAVGVARETASWACFATDGAAFLFGQDEAGATAFDWSVALAERMVPTGVVVKGVDAVPVAFSDECLDVSQREGVIVDPDGPLVGFTCDDTPQESFREIAATFCEKGWTLLESGDDTRATFVKSGGSYRWAYVSCSQVPGATSVVVQCA